MDELLPRLIASDHATRCLSNRVKQVVQRSKDLASFFRRRSLAEEEIGKSLQRAAQALQETFVREEFPSQSFSSSCVEISRLQHADADCSLFFARNCSDLADETLDWSRELDRTRKSLKDSATKSDRTLFEAEASTDKARNKYDTLLDEWHRAQGLDHGKKASFSFKGPRNSLTAKQIEDLKHRLDVANTDWRTKVDAAQQLRREMLQVLRPAYVARFLETIAESDAHIVLQLQRFARLAEDLNLGRASVMQPPTADRKGMHDALAEISVESDLSAYIWKFLGVEGPSAATQVGVTSLISEPLGSKRNAEQDDSYVNVPTLDVVIKQDGTQVPRLVMTCCEALERYGLDVEGIYRLSAPTSVMESVRDTILSGDAIEFSDKPWDVHALACIVKQFFRELPDTLVPQHQLQTFLGAATIDEDENQRRIAIHQAVNDLPDANYSTLRYLVFHLRRIESHAAQNLMTASNLAIIFGIQDMNSGTSLIESLLQNCHLLFDEHEL